jgi:putative FmdB family regulatory protein
LIRTVAKESPLPLYEYECRKCGRRTEKIENVSGPHLKKCPHCGGKVDPLISASAIQFKGSGWYVTDYASKPSRGDGGSKEEKPVAETKDSEKGSAAKDSSAKDSSKEKKPDKTSGKK